MVMAFTILSIIAGFAMAFTAFAMVWDIRTRTLPNWLTVPVGLLAFVFHPLTHADGWLAGLTTALAGFGVGFGILFVLWLIGGGGGGDVKMMGALGAWLGPIPTIIVFLLSAILAVIATIGLRVVRAVSGKKVSLFRSDPKEDESVKQPHRYIPYAVPVAIATWTLMILKLLAASAPVAS